MKHNQSETDRFHYLYEEEKRKREHAETLLEESLRELSDLDEMRSILIEEGLSVELGLSLESGVDEKAEVEGEAGAVKSSEDRREHIFLDVSRNIVHQSTPQAFAETEKIRAVTPNPISEIKFAGTAGAGDSTSDISKTNNFNRAAKDLTVSFGGASTLTKDFGYSN
jgi:hypothetical protein